MLQLVGVEAANGGPDRIRDYVVEAALAALAEGFALDGLVLAAQAPSGPGAAPDNAEHEAGDGTADTFLAAKLPPSCAADSELLLHIYGHLWRALQQDNRSVASELVGGRLTEPLPVTDHWQAPVGRHWLWVCQLTGGDAGPIGAVAIRKASFQDQEAAALGSLVSALAACFSENDHQVAARAVIGAETAVTLKLDGTETLAQVTADWPVVLQTPGDKPAPRRRTGAAKDADPVIATAKAAAKASRPRCEVVFAGSSMVDESTASIVLINHPDRGLRFGFAVRPAGDPGGPAEAIFTAALG